MPDRVHLELGMRYGNPSIPDALARLRAANCRRLLVLPLYPQYSATTTASTFDAVTRELFDLALGTRAAHRQPIPRRPRPHRRPRPERTRPLGPARRADRLLFSFHGIPKDYFLAGDPYHCQCHKTARLVTQALDLPREPWGIEFPIPGGHQGVAAALHRRDPQGLGRGRGRLGPGDLPRLRGGLSGDPGGNRGGEPGVLASRRGG